MLWVLYDNQYYKGVIIVTEGGEKKLLVRPTRRRQNERCFLHKASNSKNITFQNFFFIIFSCTTETYYNSHDIKVVLYPSGTVPGIPSL